MVDSRPFAVITGATSGIGHELARQFATHGFDILITAENGDLDATAGDLTGAGTTVQEVVASQLPGPYYATYAASKAFIQSFAHALRYELAGTGVTVTALLPGPTDTEFFGRAHMEGTPVGSSSKDDPAKVARDGFQALMAGKSQVVAGSLKNKIQTAGARLMPEQARAAIHARMTKPNTRG
jgi:short-subunit dehydrogenase